MRVITCASYYGTGSSAVTDFFTEFDNINSLGDYEYRFLQEPDGVADLEYNLVENNHRHNSSDSIKRFLKYIDSLKKMGYGGYDIFGNHFDECIEAYLREIVDLKTHTWWNKDRTDKGRLFCFADRVYSLTRRVLARDLHSERRFSLLQKSEWGYYTDVTEAEFLAATRTLVGNLLAGVNKMNAPFLMVDQMVPPTNTNRFIRYFDDVKIIVVDRDPRDLFLLERELWQWGIIPVKDVKEFVTWFKITRKNGVDAQEDKEKVLRIRFEDMVYDYDRMKSVLTDFIGTDLSHHIHPLEHFNPAVSIQNTNMKTRYKGYEKEISYIEENLKEFLYDFDK